MNFLNEAERQELNKFVQNDVLSGAVKKVILAAVYYNGILEAGKSPNTGQNFAIQSALFAIQNNPQVTNEQLGEGLRANVAAVRLIDLGFQELDKIKQEKTPKKVEPNPAR